MKIVSLNTWGGRAGSEGLLQFFRNHQDVDLFCLQEIWSAPYEHLEGLPAGGLVISHDKVMTHGLQQISEALPDHLPYFRPHNLDNYGLMMLVKKTIPILEEGEEFVHKFKGYVPEGDAGKGARNIQYVKVETGGITTTIINFHGLWTGQGKGDCEDRIAQSAKILEFTNNCEGEVLLCGDFNLPGTESLTVFEKAGFRNLITEYGVTSTRTSHYDKDVKYADYAFATAGIEVLDFKVLPDEVSDHAPLYLEIA